MLTTPRSRQNRAYFSTAAFLKFSGALVFILLLNGCLGGDTTPTVSDIQAKNLNYGAKAQFDFFGTYLDKGLSAEVPNCVSQTPAYISPVHQTLTCTVTATGDLGVLIRDGAGNVIFSKAFTVPPPQVMLLTSMGNIVAELNPTVAPLTVNNFLAYVQSSFYTNTLFHRVIAGFVIQGGAFTPGLVARPGARPPITLESDKGLSNQRGTLAMARTSEPDSATSQFYFNLVDNLSLDYQDAGNPGYAVFGKIVQGLDVMDAIGAVPTATQDSVPDIPVTDVVVKGALRIQ